VAVLIDTNVLIFSLQQGHPWGEVSPRAIKLLLAADEAVCVLPQNIAEFWNVCTRPADKNGLGLTPQEAEKRLNSLDSILTVLHDTPAVYSHWRKLLVEHEVKGVQVHDARIAGAMQVHGIERLLTYNPRDFNRYAGITPVSPEAIVGRSAPA
jgi:predicted nucleic acid-binding protein